MRLSKEQCQIIRKTVEDMLGADVQIVLFGSRVNDDLRGGDVDLMVTTPHNVTQPAFAAARVAARLERVLGGRRVDVVLVTPKTAEQPIHKIAARQGVLL